MSRYLYEHLFFAHVYFGGRGAQSLLRDGALEDAARRADRS